MCYYLYMDSATGVRLSLNQRKLDSLQAAINYTAWRFWTRKITHRRACAEMATLVTNWVEGLPTPVPAGWTQPLWCLGWRWDHPGEVV